MRLSSLWSLVHRPPTTTGSLPQTGPLCLQLLPQAGPLRLLLLLSLLLCAGQAQLVNPQTTLGCHIRSYQFRVTKTPLIDSRGNVLRCSGVVTVQSCWGRCDSSEVGDYLMPYRISNHPVCSYTGKTSRRVILPGCGDYPDPTVEIFDAIACECRKCDSDFTSCENLNG